MGEQTLRVDTGQADLDSRAAIEDVLWSIDAARITHPDLEVTVKDGHAVIRGVVDSPMIQEMIEEALNDLPGLAGLTFDLTNDGEIEHKAAYKLATDPGTRGIRPGYRLASHHGHVHLVGKLSPEESAAAKEVIGSVKGVRSVKVD